MINQFNWREAKSSDAAEIVAMIAAENRQDSRFSVPDEAHIKHTLERVLSTPNGNVTVVLSESGTMIGMSLVMFVPDGEKMQGHSIGHVHIDYRGQGLGTQLLDWLSECAKKIKPVGEENSPIQLLTSCRGFMEDRIALFEDQGFAPVRYALKMRCDLTSSFLAHELPKNIRIKRWTEEQDDRMRRLFNLAFKENWGVGEVDPDEWRKRFISTPHFAADLTYLAYFDDTLVGFCLTEHHAERNTQTNLNEAWMEAIAVHPDWRGGGIASGMMTHAMEKYREVGFTHAGLDVDADNITNALSLYKKLGFVEVSREIIYGKNVG